jgi:hypothetical protein
MMIPLGAFFSAAAAPLARKVIAGLGMGIISYGAVLTALTYALDYAQSAYTGLPALMIALLNLGGIGEGLGMIAGALTFQVTVAALPKLGVIPT